MGHMALVIDRRGATLEAGNHDTVVVRHGDGTTQRVGMRALASVVINGDVMVSTHLLRKLCAHHVGVVMLPTRGLSMDIAISRLPSVMAELRHLQHVAHDRAEIRLQIARAIVHGKIVSQWKLQRAWEFDTAHPGDLGVALDAGSNIQALMGIEGGHAQQHLRRMASRLGPEWDFAQRNRRPPRDPINALLSLGYCMAEQAIGQRLLAHGLDLQVGFLHGIQGTRQSLVLDVIEPVRCVIEEWLLELVMGASAEISVSDFSHNDADGCRLSKGGRSFFYRRWFAEGQSLALDASRPVIAIVLKALRAIRPQFSGTGSLQTDANPIGQS